MKTGRAILFLASFAGLAATAAVAVDRMGRPSIASPLVGAVAVATAAGVPGLLRRRAWPVALALLPLGAVLVLRTQMPAPADVSGVGAQAAFYLGQLRSGARTYVSHGFPMDFATAGDLKLLLVLVVYVVSGVAAFLALGLRRVVPAIALLVVPLGFGVTVDRELRAPGLTLAFLAFAACLLLASRALERRRWGAGDAAMGMGVTAVAGLAAVVLLATTSLAASRPWQDWRTWDLSFGDDARFVFDSMEGYAGLLDPDNDTQVMRVRSPVALYWRANALDEFDGSAWFSGAARPRPLKPDARGDQFTYVVPELDLVPQGPLVRQSFDVRAMRSDYFFTGGVARTLTVGVDVPVRARQTYALGVDRPLGPAFRYSVTAVVPEVRATDLVGRGRDYPEQVARRAALPFATPADGAATAAEGDWRSAMAETPEHREWLGLYQLNHEVVGEATDPYEIALRIERYLRLNYAYTSSPASPADDSPYATFLFTTRRGFCQHFAGAMAVLLRFNGVPARVAVGFTPGLSIGEDVYVVSRNDAHAWVEAYFPGVGWVAFEPTPGQAVPGQGASSTSAGFSDPFAGDLPTSRGETAAPRRERPRGMQEAPTAAVTGDRTSAAPQRQDAVRRWLPWASVGAAALVVVGWPVARALLRRRALRRGDMGRRLRAALKLVRADLTDFGFAAAPSQTLDETATFVARRFSLDAGPLVARVQAVLFGGRAATADDVAAVAAFRRELHRHLRAGAGPLRTLLALYGAGSLRPRHDRAHHDRRAPDAALYLAPRVGR